MQLEKYGHGGDLLTAEETYGKPREQFIDFSSNMNPFGPPDTVRELLRERWADVAKYPDPAVRELRRKLAACYDVPADGILVGNGAAELIDLAVRALRPARTALARPSFSEYEEAITRSGGAIVDIPLLREDGFALREEALDAAVRQADLVFLGHPNNPTGKLIPQPLLDRFVSSGERTLLLDEAFVDFAPHEDRVSLIRQAAASRRLLVIRSMTKFYAIPGIRLGFIVAHPELIARMRALQVQWSVNYMAQLIGAAVLDDRAYAEATLRWLQEERPWLAGQLAALGLTVFASDANFMLFALPGVGPWNARSLQRLMGQRGVLIRDASLFRGLDGAYCRVAVRRRDDNERLVAALRESMAAMADEAASEGGDE